METLLLILNYLTAGAWLVVAIRLLAFRRQHRRYRPLVSLCAWLFINLSFYSAWAFLMVGDDNFHTAFITFLASVYFASRALLWHGNLIKILTADKILKRGIRRVFL